MEKIKFGDLSAPLKVFVCMGWVLIGLFVIAFLIGFIGEMLI